VAFNAPVLVPIAVGLNATFIVQIAPAPSVVPHVRLAMTKSPLVNIEVMLTVTVALLVRIRVFAGLVVLMSWTGNAKAAGRRLPLTVVPVPVKATT
jgi:hypothetical protein